MAKIRRGGVTGFARGRAGNYVYAVMPGSATSSGSREQIVRQAPDGVANPKTVGQAWQRMKVGPAQRFYNAFKELLSNAFQGVAYGNRSRRYFLSKAMKSVGPYIPRGVDRFIPAEYLFSEGALPTIGFADRASFITDEGDSHSNNNLVTNIKKGTGNPDGPMLAEKLGVPVGTQITVVVVTNDNGVFTPHYAGLENRITLADVGNMTTSAPGSPSLSSVNIDDDAYISFYLDGFGLPTNNVVAAAVVLSRQDASGTWLRSTQTMQVNQKMYDDLYSSEEFNAAIASYQADGTQNSVGNTWYYNLGLYGQDFNGRIAYVGNPMVYKTGIDNPVAAWLPGTGPLTGIYADGRRVLFGSISGTTATVYCVNVALGANGPEISGYHTQEIANWDTERNMDLEPWQNSYAVQAGVTAGSTPSSDDDDDDNP